MGSYVKELASNSADIFERSARLIIKIADTILSHPDVPKYRQVNISTPSVMERIVQVSGAFDALLAMGFVEESGTEFLRLPTDAPLAAVRKVRDELLSLVSSERVTTAARAPPPSLTPPAGSSTVGESAFLRQLESNFNFVLIYENPHLQSKARAVIPFDRLSKQAQEKLARISRASANSEAEAVSASSAEKPLDLRDLELIELMDWFKYEFFRWFDKPTCPSCSSSTVAVGGTEPTSEERKWLAHKTELYSCISCRAVVRFPRYNHPEVLLETREGRCGEWANCFTLLCRALGYEARYVLDWTDHVWTEVFCKSQERWIPCDPGEVAFDSPLLYESGWGKKLTYVIAFSKDDIADVTWRYSSHHAEVRARRTELSEHQLAAALNSLRTARQRGMAADQRLMHQIRLVKELCELLTERKATGKEKAGRQTGSLAWRLARGEVGSEVEGTATAQRTFTPSDACILAKRMRILYSSASDRYELRSLESAERTYINGWINGVHQHDGMFRKVERDWNMVYLARQPDADRGTVSWCIDLRSTGQRARKVTVVVQSTTFDSGTVKWSLCGSRRNDEGSDCSGDVCVQLFGDGKQRSFAELEGCDEIVLSALLGGGSGAVAWQHAQLFRQSLKNSEEPSYELDVLIDFD